MYIITINQNNSLSTLSALAWWADCLVVCANVTSSKSNQTPPFKNRKQSVNSDTWFIFLPSCNLLDMHSTDFLVMARRRLRAVLGNAVWRAPCLPQHRAPRPALLKHLLARSACSQSVEDNSYLPDISAESLIKVVFDKNIILSTFSVTKRQEPV